MDEPDYARAFERLFAAVALLNPLSFFGPARNDHGRCAPCCWMGQLAAFCTRIGSVALGFPSDDIGSSLRLGVTSRTTPKAR